MYHSLLTNRTTTFSSCAPTNLLCQLPNHTRIPRTYHTRMPKLGGRVSSSSYNPYPSEYKKSSHKRTSTLLDIVDSKFGPTQSTPTDTKEPVKACAGSSKKKAGVPPVEKRGAIFKKACPKTILERVDRVVSQRWIFHPLKANI